jgi:hypothetical protein
MASELAYMIANTTLTSGRTFEKLVFNDKNPTRDPVTGEQLTPTPFHSTSQGFSGASGRPLPTLNLDRVYIISGPGTCSASESIINSLRGVNVQVYLIGSTTCGKPYGFYPQDNCGTTYFSIEFRGENAANFGDYSDGFSPANQTGTVVSRCRAARWPTTSRMSSAMPMKDASPQRWPSGRATTSPVLHPAEYRHRGSRRRPSTWSRTPWPCPHPRPVEPNPAALIPS